MVEAVSAVGSAGRPQSKELLTYGMGAIVALHTVVILVMGPGSVAASRILTAAIPVLAGIACLWRTRRLPARERISWRWASAGLFLWAIAHVSEIVVGHSVSASNLAVDPSDFIYVASTFPILLALSTTRETESLRAVFLLNCAQIALALGLSYVLLYRLSMTPEAASTVMGRIYGVACALLAVMAVLRALTWSTREERNCIRWIGIFLWTYLPVELAMDYATLRWNLRAGNLFDLFWSVPFFIAGWFALQLPPATSSIELPKLLSRGRLLVEALCPMLLTTGLFALAASIAHQHLVLSLSSIFLLLTIQGLQAALVQLNYLKGRSLLLDREHDLRTANSALQQMSLEDPLTGIANRRRFVPELENAWRRAIRKRQPLALLMLDVDFFKGVNDRHGHAYGDECLIAIARIMSLHARRPDDIVARLGGEEFALLLPDTDAAGAAIVAARLQESIAAMGTVNEVSPFDNRLTASIGIGVVTAPQLSVDPMILVNCADQALYDAKGTGRNKNCTRSLD